MTLKVPQANVQTIPVSHYSGCGNDFLLLDNRQSALPSFSNSLIRKLCQPESGAGVDGLIIAESSKSADVAMRYYNADGSEAEMCGNGVRCLMQYLRQKLHYPRTRCLLETKHRELIVTCDEEQIAVAMGQIEELGWNIILDFEGVSYTMHHLNTGVPHVVIFVEDLQEIDVNHIGRHFRFHDYFMPKGTNVNFVELGLQHLQFTAHIRTYERGVERETLACGTGVTAAAYCLQKLYGFHSPIAIQVQSDEWLEVAFEEIGHTLDNVTLKGPATWLRDGEIQLDTASQNFSLTFE